MRARHRHDDQPGDNAGANPARRLGRALLAARPWRQRKYQVAAATAAAVLVSVGAFAALGTGDHPGNSGTSSGNGAETAGASELAEPLSSPAQAPLGASDLPQTR